MELRQLRCFVTVAEELHFGRAAQRMHIVQPAVSQQVRRLERELGLRLFDRSPRHVRLTAAGERLLPEARAALAAADRVTATATTLTSTGRGEMRIGAGPGLSASLQPGLAKLRTCVPQLSLRLAGGPLPGQLEALRSGDLDLVMVRGEGDWPEVETFRLRDEPVTIALPARHPLASEPGIRLDRLVDLQLRLPPAEEDPAFRRWALDACRRAGFEPRLGRTVGRLPDALVEIGSGEDAWTMLTKCGAEAEPPAGVAFRPMLPQVRIPVLMVVPGFRETACVHSLLEAFGAPAPTGP